MILATGAAGKTGRAVIRALVRRGETVRALVHRKEQVRLVRSLGAREVVVGEMRDEALLERAARGVRAIYHICPNMNPDEISIGKAAIGAARAAGVERFVFHSVLHPQIEAMPHHWNKLRVEEALFESQVPCTILQPSNYMQNIITGLQPTNYMRNALDGWRIIVEHRVYAVPYSVESRMRMNMVDLEDVAEAAAVVLTEPGHFGAIYELAGPDNSTQSQVAEVLSKRLRREVRAQQVPVEVWRRQAEASGMGSHQIETLVKMFQYYDRHDFLGNPRILGHLIRRATATLDAFVERTVRERLRE